ncbi:MAG: hypothetical protein ACOYN0_17330, partial [Phycisphaerales bacterium]
PGHKGLVSRDFDGRVRVLDGTVPEEALALLTLSAREREATGALLGRRAKLLEDFVSENVFLLGKIDTAEKAGNKADVAWFILEAVAKLKPVTKEGTLEQQLAKALDKPNADRLLSLVREYDRAAIKDRCSRVNKDGKLPSKFEAAAGLRVESFGREIERAYKRLESSGELGFRLIFQGVKLTDAQQDKVRELMELHQRTTKGNATEKENATLFMAILPHLSKEQAARAIANIKGLEQGKPAKPVEPKKPKAM